jgi:hypothetical protein
MIIKSYADIKEMWSGAYFSMIDDDPKVIDYYQRNIIHSHNNHIVARSAVFDFDLGDIGLTPTKWTKFTGQYVDVESLHAWVNNAMNVKSYDALWPFKSVPPNFGGKKAVHQWGSCLLGFSFRRIPKPATLTLFTRAQSLGFSGVADYALGDFVARRLAERMGIQPESIKFQVYCPNFMIKMVEVPQYLTKLGKFEEYLQADTRIGESLRYYDAYMKRDNDDIRWRAARRMKNKLENAQNGVHREFLVPELQLRGWHNEGRIRNKSLNPQQVMELVLAGKHRRPDVVDEIEPGNPVEIVGPIDYEIPISG